MLKSQLLETMESVPDPALPKLASALDAELMLATFGAQMPALGLTWGWRVAKCAIEKVYYHPHKRCGILYHLRFRDHDENEADEWVYGEMLPPGDDAKRFRKIATTAAVTPQLRMVAQASLPADQISALRSPPITEGLPAAPHSSCECLRAAPAVSLWQDFNMILRIFPNDAELEFMPRVIDPAYVKSVVESHLSALGLPSPASGLCWRCEEARYDHIKLLPGKRCVLRHRATLVGPDNEKRELRFFSKTYADHRTRPSFDLLRTAYDHLAAGDERINIPKPLFYLEECETYWQEEWPGQALSEVAADYDWGELFPRLAQMLGLVHRKSIAGLEAAPTIEEIFREVSRDAMKLVQAMPPAQGLMEVVLDKLQEHKDALAAQSLPAATLHGACRLEQFLIQGRELALIDFDALAQGDPLADVAEFIASLQYMELSRGFPRARINRGIALLGESYAAQTSWPYEAQRVAWYVLSFLITKMYSATKNLDTEALHGLKTVGQEICESWLARL